MTVVPYISQHTCQHNTNTEQFNVQPGWYCNLSLALQSSQSRDKRASVPVAIRAPDSCSFVRHMQQRSPLTELFAMRYDLSIVGPVLWLPVRG